MLNNQKLNFLFDMKKLGGGGGGGGKRQLIL